MIAAREENLSYYVQDEMKSTMFLLDEAQNIKKSYRYDAFGGIMEEGGSLENRITYTGQLYDGKAAQYYLRARYYNPRIGRFLQEDTYRGDGLNLYAYCQNNPVRYYDPSGYMTMCPDYGKPNKGTGDPTSLNPNDINFSQRTVSGNVEQYTQDMINDNWEWNEQNTIRIIDNDGQWVSYDNRRLMAAQNAGLDSIPVIVVKPNDIMPGSNTTWGNAFTRRFNDWRNVKAGGIVPNTGLSPQPTVVPKK